MAAMPSGGDPNIPNSDGTLPAQLAISFGEESRDKKCYFISVILGHYDVAKLLTQ